MTLTYTARPWSPSYAAQGAAVEDYCVADPAAPAARWAYERASIGIVLTGWFDYSSNGRSVFVGPGTLLLGNAGEPFAVRHADARGTRRLVVALGQELMMEVASEAGLPPRFRASTVPPGPSAAYVGALMRALPIGSDDALYLLAEAALRAPCQAEVPPSTAADRARVQNVVRQMQARLDQSWPLQSLAAIAGVSRFHFVKMFSSVMGITPNRYLINMRLRAAADLLITTRTPIAEVIYEVGFNDVSHFYSCFRDTFHCTPQQWRLRA